MVLFLFYELPYFCINAEKLFVNLFIELKPMRIFFLGLISLFITSCVDIFDDITIHADGSGTYKYTINMSASKVKINSILALDSLDDHRVPKIPEIKEKIEHYRALLEEKDGISNVKVVSNFDEFLFKFSCDFESVSKLQEAIREIVKEESKDKTNPALNESWISWSENALFRIIPNFQSIVAKMKPEDQEKLKEGKYNAVSRFDKPVLKCDNPQAQISPTKLAVMVRTSSFAAGTTPTVLKTNIQVDY